MKQNISMRAIIFIECVSAVLTGGLEEQKD